MYINIVCMAIQIRRLQPSKDPEGVDLCCKEAGKEMVLFHRRNIRRFFTLPAPGSPNDPIHNQKRGGVGCF